ncbi:MAG: STAS domain-containing protein [bacterium]
MKMDKMDLNGLLVCALEGDFDNMTAGRTKDDIKALIRAGNKDIIVDLAGVKYIDSAGMGTLISVLKATRESGGNMRVTSPSTQVRMVLELTRLNKVFEIYDTVDDAVAMFSKSGKTGKGK